MTREEREDAIDIIQSILNKYEEDECLVTEITIGDGDIKAFRMAIEVLEQEPTTEENLAVDLIDRAELLKAMDTWDKFGYTARYRLERLDKDDKDFVAYVKYDDMVNCVNGMPSVTPQYPRKGYLSIDDVMSVFDDFMCGEVDEDGTETFLEMLKDRAESEVNNG